MKTFCWRKIFTSARETFPFCIKICNLLTKNAKEKPKSTKNWVSGKIGAPNEEFFSQKVKKLPAETEKLLGGKRKKAQKKAKKMLNLLK